VKVIFTPEAKADLAQITDYIAEHGRSTALAFVNELNDKCASLADAPRGYPLLPRYEHLGIRRRPVGNYLILYRVGHAIEVIRVLHAARDYEQLLFPKR
jgi:addiction module RelE/StbE family toxin